MLVVWLAYQAEGENPGPATDFWQRHYHHPDSLHKIDYAGFSLLSDQPDYLSHFIVQQCFYLCAYFSGSEAYLQFFENAARADRAWWQAQTGNSIEPFEWGLGAGASEESPGYTVDRLNHNPSLIVSPGIVAGFLPADERAASDLETMIVRGKGVYVVNGDSILWRYSKNNPNWTPNEIQAVDQLPFLLGASWFKWGAWFLEKNHFTLPPHPNSTPTGGLPAEGTIKNMLRVFPNPFTERLTIEFIKTPGPVEMVMYPASANGSIVSFAGLSCLPGDRLSLECSSIRPGIYIFQICELETQIMHHVKVIKL
jgi:hypothetical protein